MESIFTPELIWITAGIILFIFEMIIPGFILAFFGLGAWFTALFSWLNIANDLGTQLLVFLVTSLISLVTLRRTLKEYFYGNVSEENNSDDLLEGSPGELVEVIEDIGPRNPGKVRYRGSNWKALSTEHLSQGSRAEIVNRENITLHVKKPTEKE